MAKRLPLAETTDGSQQSLVDQSEDNRAPLLNVIRANARTRVTQTDLFADIGKHLLASKLDLKHVAFIGSDSGKYFAMRVKRGKIAALDAKRLLAYSFNDGDWIEFHATGPEGQVQYHLDADKSPRQGRIELAGRMLRVVLRTLHPTLVCQLNKKEGVISVGQVPIARCSSATLGEFNVEFNAARCQTLSLDMCKIREELSKVFLACAEDIIWSP